jgi:hypothetical protein
MHLHIVRIPQVFVMLRGYLQRKALRLERERLEHEAAVQHARNIASHIVSLLDSAVMEMGSVSDQTLSPSGLSDTGQTLDPAMSSPDSGSVTWPGETTYPPADVEMGESQPWLDGVQRSTRGPGFGDSSPQGSGRVAGLGSSSSREPSRFGRPQRPTSPLSRMG